jgi:hypothetical protein
MGHGVSPQNADWLTDPVCPFLASCSYYEEGPHGQEDNSSCSIAAGAG